MSLTDTLQQLLDRRRQQQSLRKTVYLPHLLDFCSNDYLGLARSEALQQLIHQAVTTYRQLGATGSRLLTGHHPLIDEVEAQVADFHQAPSALLFNSGYDANLSLLSCLPRRRDLVLYDAFIHASLHDGIKLGGAEAKSFAHNNLEELSDLLTSNSNNYENIFIVIESVYSMDGDAAPLREIAALTKKYGAYLIVDEAHSTGVMGANGEGMAVELGVTDACFARLHTFGKAMGGHGAMVLGSPLLREFLLNFARSLIYTTALPIHSILHIKYAYGLLAKNGENWVPLLQQKINLFAQLTEKLPAPLYRQPSQSPIQSILVGGNAPTKALSQKIQTEGFDVRAILSPTVPTGSERLRICLHLFNTEAQIEQLCGVLKDIS